MTTLYIGSKQFSSWSMRPWLCLQYAGIDFKEVIIPLRTDQTKAEISAVSPSKKVPCLDHNGLLIWDSLAICEFINELKPEAELLPKNQEKRAIIRSVIAEMHSGFLDLRKEMPMDTKLKTTQIASPEAQINIDRILEIWALARKKYGADGEFLFGKFSIADAFFAPVVSRFVSYGVDVKEMKNYVKTMTNLSIYQDWVLA
ncbi:MAG: glutathione S-transferase family protein [Pseudomonadota bacterium]